MRKLLPLVLLALSGCRGFHPWPSWDRTGELYSTTANYTTQEVTNGEDACFLGKAGVQGGWTGGQNAMIVLPLPSLLVAYPLMYLEKYTLAPLCDTLMLPRDLYVRQSLRREAERGIDVEVLDHWGRPVAGRPVAFFPIPRYSRNSCYYDGAYQSEHFATVKSTDANGHCHFPIALSTTYMFDFDVGGWTHEGYFHAYIPSKLDETHYRLQLEPMLDPHSYGRTFPARDRDAPFLSLPEELAVLQKDPSKPRLLAGRQAFETHLENLCFQPLDNERPADFDAYWEGELARLDREVPFAAELTALPERSTATTEVFAVAFPSFGRKVHGFLAQPRGAGADDPVRHPLRIRFAEQHHEFTAETFTFREGEVTLAINVKAPETASDWKLRERNGFGPYLAVTPYAVEGINRSREEYFFHPVILGAARGVRWLLDRPEVDPARARVEGLGQGGALGLWLMALEPRIAEGRFVNPSHLYLTIRVMNWPGLLHWTGDEAERRLARARPNVPYFETQNFAPRVRGRVTLAYADCGYSTDGSVFQCYRLLPEASRKALVYSPDMQEHELLANLP